MNNPYRENAPTEKDGLFPLEKILTVSARDYCESMGKSLSYYEMRGVHVEGGFKTNSLTIFRTAVPANAEVVVDYKIFVSIAATEGYKLMSEYLVGTALIPRPAGSSSIEGLHTGVY